MQEPPLARHSHDNAGDPQTEGLAEETDGGERATAILLAVSRALISWDSFDSVSERLLRDLAGALGFTAGVLWLPTGEALLARAVWGVTDEIRLELERALQPLRLAPGVRLPGSAWARGEPTHSVVADGAESGARREPRMNVVRPFLAFPACAGEEVLGVVELYASSHTKLSPRAQGVLGTAGQLLGAVFARRRGELGLCPLTARELEVLGLAADGLTGRRIADRLEISPATVKTHFEHIFRKLDVGDRGGAVAQGIRGGLIA
jgi:DNA-binding CsgD family transcriptional regulator